MAAILSRGEELTHGTTASLMQYTLYLFAKYAIGSHLDISPSNKHNIAHSLLKTTKERWSCGGPMTHYKLSKKTAWYIVRSGELWGAIYQSPESKNGHKIPWL